MFLHRSYTVSDPKPGIVTESRKNFDSGSAQESATLLPEVERRERVLKELIIRWKDEIKAFRASGSVNENARALAGDSVNLLLCTDQTVTLLDFLVSQQVESLTWLIENQIKLHLSSGRSAEFRHSLCELKNPVYREKWAFEAGKSCPSSDFDTFATTLDEAARQNAQFGHNLELINKDPKAAFSATLEALGKNISSGKVDQILVTMVEALPAKSNFEEIEAVLPADSGKTLDRIDRARSELIRRIAESDPIAAVNYVMAHPERINPSAIGPAVESFVSKNPAAGLELIQNLPIGPHFDAAVNIASIYISLDYPTEARELASQISDPKLRAEALKNVDNVQSETARKR